MDEELLALLHRLGDTENPLTDAELADLRSRIGAIASDIDPANASDEDIAVLTEAADYSERIETEITARETAASERAEQARSLLSRIGLSDTSEDADADAEPEAGAETLADEGADADGDDEGEGDESTREGDEGGDGQSLAQAVAAAASAVEPPASPRLPTISRLAHRRPSTHAPRPTATEGRRPVLIASADIPGVAAGSEIDVEAFALGAMRKFEAVRKVRGGDSDGEKIYFGTVKVAYPDERFLDDNEDANEEKIGRVTDLAPVMAAGGICAPVAVDYNLTTIAQAGRPVRDSLAQFGASRGGVRFVLPHTLAQVTTDAPASLWTAANDANPTAPTVKPHATFVCQGVQEVLVDAVTSIPQFGNFQARFFPEQVAQYLATVDAVHARLAEATILHDIGAGSIATTADINLLGAVSDVLPTVDRAAAALRFRHRMAPEAPLRLILPEWLEDLLRADLARELPGNSGGQSERLAVADAEIARFFAVRNVNVTWAQDSPTGAATFQGFLAQGAGLLNPWPTKVIAWMFPEGSWMFLDGGELNLGMVRDSTLNRTNDFQMFSETFEKAVFRGHESLQITMDICPSGLRAGTVDTSTLCTSGS